MEQEDIERFAFYYLCGKGDKDILNGKRTMTFSEFERLIYITDFLKLSFMNAALWNQYFKGMHGKFKELEQLDAEYPICTYYDVDEDIYIQNKWVQDFCNSAPNKNAKTWLKEYSKNVYINQGWEVLGQADT